LRPPSFSDLGFPLNTLLASLPPSPLDSVLAHSAIWRGGSCAAEPAAIPTGFAPLDALLPGGGWPQAALTEILLASEGIGEIRLTLPGLARLQAEGRDIVWISPPYLPYAPALAAGGLDLAQLILVHARTTRDALWAFEQALRAPECGAAFLWPVGLLDDRSARRLQVAAREGGSWGVLWRRPGQHGIATAAPLRLALASAARQLAVQVVKRRGGEVARPIMLDLDPAPGPALAEAAARPMSIPCPAAVRSRGTQ
jgi:hypothetical protein